MFSSCDTLPNTFTGTTSAPLKVGPQDGMDIMAIKNIGRRRGVKDHQILFPRSVPTSSVQECSFEHVVINQIILFFLLFPSFVWSVVYSRAR